MQPGHSHPTEASPLAYHRVDGWTPDRQCRFLESIAEGYTVDTACRRVGLSVTSVYAFRRRASGAAFALGWSAARVLARERLADTLTARALDGQEETIARPDGTTVTRHRYDNRLAATMLTRADRYADTHDATAPGQAARVVAGDFDAYLALIAADAGPARAGLFVGTRVVEAPQPELVPVIALASADRFLRGEAGLDSGLATADLDIAECAFWTTEQWARADAAGLFQPSVAQGEAADIGIDDACSDDEDCRSDGTSQLTQHPRVARPRTAIWWDVDADDWRTHFAAPADFTGIEQGQYCDPDYARALTEEERAVVNAPTASGFVALRLGWAADSARRVPELSAPAARPRRDPNLPQSKKDRQSRRRAGALARTKALRRHPFHKRSLIMADTDRDISTLNGLIETTLDSVDGYTEAAKDTDNTRFAGLFTARATERRQVAGQLQTEVRRLGGTPEDDGTVLAGAHRVFLNLKAAVTGRDDKAIVNEVEAGEDHIKAKFEKALADTDLGVATKQEIQLAYTSVKQGHDQMRDIKHSMEA